MVLSTEEERMSCIFLVHLRSQENDFYYIITTWILTHYYSSLYRKKKTLCKRWFFLETSTREMACYWTKSLHFKAAPSSMMAP